MKSDSDLYQKKIKFTTSVPVTNQSITEDKDGDMLSVIRQETLYNTTKYFCNTI